MPLITEEPVSADDFLSQSLGAKAGIIQSIERLAPAASEARVNLLSELASQPSGIDVAAAAGLAVEELRLEEKDAAQEIGKQLIAPIELGQKLDVDELSDEAAILDVQRRRKTSIQRAQPSSRYNPPSFVSPDDVADSLATRPVDAAQKVDRKASGELPEHSLLKDASVRKRAQQYSNLFAQKESKYGLPKNLLRNLAAQESGIRPNIRVSEKLSRQTGEESAGMFMIDRPTARDPGFGVPPISDNERFSAEKSAEFAANYISAIKNRYKVPHELAVYAYNAGVGNLEKLLKGESRAISSARDYTRRVTGKDVAGYFGKGR